MRQPDSVRRYRVYAVVAVLVAVIVVAAGLAGVARGIMPKSPPRAAVPRPSATGTPSPTASPSNATAQMTALVAGLPPGSVSVAARNQDTGATFTFGSRGGQITASVVKLDLLETLLLQEQRSGHDLSDDEDSEAASMIEESDDDAASDLWNDIGGGSAMRAANKRLGVRCTVPGSGPYWGLTTTCAQGQIRLLYQLETASSPLDRSSRDYILDLMENVIPEQSWGVPVVADSGTPFAVKNGWLDVDGETDWAVNSDGIVTYDGQTLLISVLTQNDDTVYAGVALVQQLAQVAAQSVIS